MNRGLDRLDDWLTTDPDEGDGIPRCMECGEELVHADEEEYCRGCVRRIAKEIGEERDG